MILALEYIEMKNQAIESLASLYDSFLKRVDYQASKSQEEWSSHWKKYRLEEGELELSEIIELMPDWMQFNFDNFNTIHQFTQEIELAFLAHNEELFQAYQKGKKDAIKKPYSDMVNDWRMPLERWHELMNSGNKHQHIGEILEPLKTRETNQLTNNLKDLFNEEKTRLPK